jgi:hypothetical protein
MGSVTWFLPPPELLVARMIVQTAFVLCYGHLTWDLGYECSPKRYSVGEKECLRIECEGGDVIRVCEELFDKPWRCGCDEAEVSRLSSDENNSLIRIDLRGGGRGFVSFDHMNAYLISPSRYYFSRGLIALRHKEVRNREPAASISIVNFRGSRYLKGCVEHAYSRALRYSSPSSRYAKHEREQIAVLVADLPSASLEDPVVLTDLYRSLWNYNEWKRLIRLIMLTIYLLFHMLK